MYCFFSRHFRSWLPRSLRRSKRAEFVICGTTEAVSVSVSKTRNAMRLAWMRAVVRPVGKHPPVPELRRVQRPRMHRRRRESVDAVRSVNLVFSTRSTTNAQAFALMLTTARSALPSAQRESVPQSVSCQERRLIRAVRLDLDKRVENVNVQRLEFVSRNAAMIKGVPVLLPAK